MRGGERRRVVETVADHQDAAAMSFERFDECDLVGRLQATLPIDDAERAGDRLHCVFAIAGQDVQIEPKPAKRLHHLDRVRPQLLADRDGRRLPAMGKINVRGARLVRYTLRDAAKFGAAEPRFGTCLLYTSRAHETDSYLVCR